MTPKERQRQVLAWTVLLTSFAVFLTLVVGVFVVGRWYVSSATESQSAYLSIVSGTVLVREADQSAWVGAMPEMSLDDGVAVRTDDTSEARITLFDGSSLALYPQTELVLLTMAQGRFDPQRRWVQLVQRRGQMRVTLSPSSDGGRRFEVQAPQGVVFLNEGSFSISVQGALEVRTRSGSRGWVTGTGVSVALGSDQKTRVEEGQPPSSPQAAQEELVTNGRFRQGLAGWSLGHEAGFTPGQDIPGQAQLVSDGGEAAVRFWRQGSRSTHSEVYITLPIGRDVSDFSDLRLQVSFKLLTQSLSGGGYMGSEYPLHVRVDYETRRGENFAAWGFYYQNRDQNRTDIGALVPQGEWVNYSIDQNLMELDPPPRRILSIRVSASGWDYESLVKAVSLVGE